MREGILTMLVMVLTNLVFCPVSTKAVSTHNLPEICAQKTKSCITFVFGEAYHNIPGCLNCCRRDAHHGQYFLETRGSRHSRRLPMSATKRKPGYLEKDYAFQEEKAGDHFSSRSNNSNQTVVGVPSDEFTETQRDTFATRVSTDADMKMMISDDIEDFEQDGITKDMFPEIDKDQAVELDKSVTGFSAKADALHGLDILSKTKVVVPSRASSWYKGGRAKTDLDSKSKLDQIGLKSKRLFGIGRQSKKKLLRKWSDKVLNQARLSSDVRDSGGRITRDIRQVAVSVASNIDDVWQWRLFSEEGGGLWPIFQSIQEESHLIELSMIGTSSDPSQVERSFDAACTACRALRDLCALSPELSAVITESILDASVATVNETGRSTGNRVPEGVIASLALLLDFSMGEERKDREKARLFRLYVVQLLLAMAVASDAAVYTLRSTPGLMDSIISSSSYSPYSNRWQQKKLQFPLRFLKRPRRPSRAKLLRPPVGTLEAKICGAANELLAAIGYNLWVPKDPKQKGLRILCLDGGGTRGISAITSLQCIVDAIGGIEVCDAFDIIAGTSTGAIIAFLVGLRRETSGLARKRYDMLIKRIFVKTPLSTPMLILTTASYDESHFMEVMNEILGDASMLDSRADPDVPLVFAVASKMSSNPTGSVLFRNYNYSGGELPDTFVVDPKLARADLRLKKEESRRNFGTQTSFSKSLIPRESRPAQLQSRSGEGSRHSGSFRVPQKVALRATTAAPTFFKPVLMGGELYCDGGMVASNPAAVAIHEARILFPDTPIELVVSCGTGVFREEKSSPRIGWDGIIGQIVSSALDGEQTHHVLEDILGQGGTAHLGRSAVSRTRYFRFNPLIGIPDDFPIDVTDPEKLAELCKITENYLKEPKQARKIKEIGDILHRRSSWGRTLFRQR